MTAGVLKSQVTRCDWRIVVVTTVEQRVTFADRLGKPQLQSRWLAFCFF